MIKRLDFYITHSLRMEVKKACVTTLPIDFRCPFQGAFECLVILVDLSNLKTLFLTLSHFLFSMSKIVILQLIALHENNWKNWLCSKTISNVFKKGIKEGLEHHGICENYLLKLRGTIVQSLRSVPIKHQKDNNLSSKREKLTRRCMV